MDLFVYAVHVLGKVDIEKTHFSLILTSLVPRKMPYL